MLLTAIDVVTRNIKTFIWALIVGFCDFIHLLGKVAGVIQLQFYWTKTICYL